MSKYCTQIMEHVSLQELEAALRTLGVATLRAGPQRRIMLNDSFECAGEPVDFKVAAGKLDNIEEFGFRVEDGQLEFICSDMERRRLEQSIVPRVIHALTQARLLRQNPQGLALEVRGRRLLIQEENESE